MNTKRAIKILKSANYLIEEIGNGYWRISYPGDSDFDSELSTRELIKEAKEYTSERQQTNIKKKTKDTCKRKNRAKTREILEKGKYELFSSHNKVYHEDIWNWD